MANEYEDKAARKSSIDRLTKYKTSTTATMFAIGSMAYTCDIGHDLRPNLSNEQVCSQANLSLDKTFTASATFQFSLLP